MDGMLTRMTSRQFSNWKAYSELEPFGPLNSWWQIAHVKWAIAAAQGSKQEPKDFYPDPAGDMVPKEQTPEQIFRNLQAAFGGA